MCYNKAYESDTQYKEQNTFQSSRTSLHTGTINKFCQKLR